MPSLQMHPPDFSRPHRRIRPRRFLPDVLPSEFPHQGVLLVHHQDRTHTSTLTSSGSLPVICGIIISIVGLVYQHVIVMITADSQFLVY